MKPAIKVPGVNNALQNMNKPIGVGYCRSFLMNLSHNLVLGDSDDLFIHHGLEYQTYKGFKKESR